MYQLEYIHYIVALLILSGIYSLGIDVNAFKKLNMNKEKKFAKFLGYWNVIVGVLLFASNWVINKWFW